MTEPAPESGFPADQIQAQIEAAVENALKIRDAQHAEEMAALRRDVAGVPLTFVPAHAGGPDTEIRPTWSLAEQEKLRAKMLNPA